MPFQAFATLLLAHLIADFPLQSNWIYRLKNASNVGIALHSLIHVLAAVVLARDTFHFWWYWLFLFVTHFITDWVKLRVKTAKQWIGFLVDQLVHLSVVIIMVWMKPDLTSVLPLTVLYPLLILGFVPAIFMFYWIWALDQGKEKAKTSPRLAWMQQHLLRVSQLSGYPVVVLMVGALLYSR